MLAENQKHLGVYYISKRGVIGIKSKKKARGS